MKNINPGDEMSRISGGRNANPFIHYYTLYYTQLVFFANKIVDNLSEAEDITSEVFKKAYELFESRQIAQLNPEAYLFTAVRNACFNYLDKNKVKARFTLWYSRHGDSAEDTGEYEKLHAEVMVRVHNLVAKLPPLCKRVFYESCFRERSRQEIADLLGISEQKVKKLRETALNKLRAELGGGDLELYLLYLPLFFDNQFIETLFS